jgi:hypothetical protein
MRQVEGKTACVWPNAASTGIAIVAIRLFTGNENCLTNFNHPPRKAMR